MNYKNKTIFGLIIIGIVLLIPGINGLAMLEPISQDLTYTDVIDVGFAAPNEDFMVSFLVAPNEDYDTIDVIETQRKDIIIENTKRTSESIYTTIKIDSDISGTYQLNLVLKGKINIKYITLKMDVTDEVIYSILKPYDNITKYNAEKEIYLRIINKSICTKTIIVSSDLSEYWFPDNAKIKIYTLQPNSTTDINYTFVPKEIGKKNFELKVYTKYVDSQFFTDQESNYKSYLINIEVVKTLGGVYGSLDHIYPLFNANMMPVYFFNKIVKLIVS